MKNQTKKSKIKLAVAAMLYATAGAYLYKCKDLSTNKKRKTREWVKQWRTDKEESGSFQFVQMKLRLQDKNAYRGFLRMDENAYSKLLELVTAHISRQDTIMRPAISANECLSLTLRFLATGETYRSLEYQTRLSKSFISEAVIRCCSAIYSQLKGVYLRFPESKDEWREIATNFFNRWHFPLCLGALDGKHIAFKASKADGAFYYCYKGFNSIVLLAMCDANYKFIFVDIGCNGRVSDGGVLNRSDFRVILNNASTYLPEDEVIGNNKILPYCIIGDDAFPLQHHILKPYPYSTKDKKEKTFNFRFSHARQTIEHAFGMLANRFRVLQTCIYLRLDKVKKVVQASCVLHNFLIENSRNYMDVINCGPVAYTRSEDSIAHIPRRPERMASAIRDEYADYFSDEGKLPWQDLYI